MPLLSFYGPRCPLPWMPVSQPACHVTHMKFLWMLHVTYIHQSCHAYEWVASACLVCPFLSTASFFSPVPLSLWHLRLFRYSTALDVYRHESLWVISHEWMRHVTHIKESCHLYEWVASTSLLCLFCWYASFICYSRALNALFLHEWAMSKVRISDVTPWHTNESCHTHEWVASISFLYLFHSYGSFIH